MLKFLFFILFISLASSAQVISGKILDENNQGLTGANIYFDGTTIATIADKNGEFTLRYDTQLKSVLVISFIGYQTQFIKDFDTANPLTITLKEKVDSLEEVIVKKDRFSRKEKLRLFREQFLGDTPLGKKAKIENEDALYFEYDETAYRFKAYADEPLIIMNELLGYRIVYELVDFEVKFSHLSIDSHYATRSLYVGVARFEDINSNEKTVGLREKCYKGSTLHFFRSLVSHALEKEKFVLFKGGYGINSELCFTISPDGNSNKVDVKNQFNNPGKFFAAFNIVYDKKMQSKIIFETNTFFVDKYGVNSNINQIVFSGDMVSKRVGGLLPLNYGIE